MVLFSTDTGLELIGVFGLISRAESMNSLHKKGGPAGVCRPPLQWLSQFPFCDKEINNVCFFFDCLPFFSGIAWYLSWVITMAFLVRR